MALLPPEPAAPATETPDPKAAPADPSSSAGNEAPKETSDSGGASTPTDPKAAPSKAKADFEAKLEELAEVDLSTKERAKEVEKATLKYQWAAQADEHLSKGELRAALRTFLRDKYTPELLVELAGDFAPEELTVEEQVKRTLAAEQLKKDEAAKKKAEEEVAAELAEYQDQQKRYLGVTANALRLQKDKFPLIVAWDQDPRVDHEKMIRDILEAHMKDPAKADIPPPLPLQVLQQIEDGYKAIIERTPYAPKKPRDELSFEEHVAESSERARPPATPPIVVTDERLSGADEARRRLESEDRERNQRSRLQYSNGRR